MSMKVSVLSRWKVLTPLFMKKLVKWLCHVFNIKVYFVKVFQCKKDWWLPENAQDSTIYYLHSHLKNTVKLHITHLDTEYVCFTFLLHVLFSILIWSQNCTKEKNTPLFTTNINSLWVEMCTTVNNFRSTY